MTAFRALTTSLLATCWITAFAGPFGLTAGMSASQLGAIVPLTQKSLYEYSSSKVPIADSRFSQYTFLITPAHGLCRVVAFTGPIQTNSDGTELVEKFRALESGLVGIYGPATKKYDDVRNSPLTDKNQWMEALHGGSRRLQSGWINMPAAHGVLNMGLLAGSYDFKQGGIQLFVDLKNAVECLALIRASDKQTQAKP